MANQEYLELLLQGVPIWNQWRGEHPEIEPFLWKGSHGEISWRCLGPIRPGHSDAPIPPGSRIDLREADLSGLMLHEANLCGADLSQSTLTDADLSEAFLVGADA